MDKNEAIEKLTAGIRKLCNSEDWKRYLQYQARFHNYSINNILMIMFQNPEATKVAGMKAWNEMGRKVKKGEKAIRIFAPAFKKVKDEESEDEKRRLAGFFLTNVFDVSQTEGEPLPEICQHLDGDDQGLFQVLKNFSEERDIPVYRRKVSQGNGYYDPSTQEIVISIKCKPLQALKTLAHEVAHSLLHNDLEVYRAHRGDCELEAESTAFIVLNHFGIDSGEYTFGYVSSWQGGDSEKAEKTIRESANKIQKAAKEIIEYMEKEARRLEDLAWA